MKTLLKILLSLSPMMVFVQCQCLQRNITAANAVGRPCRKSCVPGDSRCKNGKVCMCDHECGYSCINLKNQCEAPPNIPNSSRVRIFRKHENGLFVPITNPPYSYDDVGVYVCKPGYERGFPYAQHLCHGRRRWTLLDKAICTKICQTRNIAAAELNGIVCGQMCSTDIDCPKSLNCQCISHCGRSCTEEAWSSWSYAGSCSVTCGGGNRLEIRRCISGTECVGGSTHSVNCNMEECPMWSKWSSIGSCSVTCGVGRRQKVRSCINGPGCVGNKLRSVHCNNKKCPGKWSSWRISQSCSKTCGIGTSLYERTCLNGGICEGEKYLAKTCSSIPCPEMDNTEEHLEGIFTKVTESELTTTEPNEMTYQYETSGDEN